MELVLIIRINYAGYRFTVDVLDFHGNVTDKRKS